MWFKLNNRTRISILTPVGETDTATIYNGIGQESFGAALASSINIGCAVYDKTIGKFTSNIGPMPLNCPRYWRDAGFKATSCKRWKVQILGDRAPRIEDRIPKGCSK